MSDHAPPLLSSHFDYELPPERIAQKPVEPRDQSRLLLCQGRGRLGEFESDALDLSDLRFAEITSLLNAGDLLVMNDAKVLPVRLLGHRELPDGKRGGDVEALLLRPEEAAKNGAPVWTAILHMSAKAKPGLRFVFKPGLVAECLSTHEQRLAREGEVRLEFSGFALERMSLESWLIKHGSIPLPPYIERDPTAQDLDRYQTVYASKIGSAAAPTAGFHFTEDLMQALRQRGVQFANLTLHIGIGTFRPIKTESLAEHQMHHETFEVTSELAARIRDAKSKGKRIVAVGTTVVRALESWWQATGGDFEPGIYKTNLFITPGFRFRVVDDLITNFHLPRSTLLVLVSAACDKRGRGVEARAAGTAGAGVPPGVSEMQRIYRHALRGGYRFFSYGDAMFIRGSSS